MKEIKQKRLLDMLRFIELHRVVSLETICREFEVSMNTVRRDVNELIESGFVRKVHGGVMHMEGESPKTEIAHYPSRAARNPEGKQRIGLLAAQLVEDGDTVFIDSGSTAAELVNPSFLKKRVSMVVSNSLPVFGKLEDEEQVRLYALGGIYVPHAHAFTGGKAVEEIGGMIISKAFLGASAVDGVFGVSNNLSYEIDLKRAVAEQAEKVILMVGSEKLGKRAAMKICAVDRLYAIVTDRKPEPELLALLEEKGVKVIY